MEGVVAHGSALSDSGLVARDQFPIWSVDNFVAAMHRATRIAHGKVCCLQLANGGDVETGHDTKFVFELFVTRVIVVGGVCCGIVVVAIETVTGKPNLLTSLYHYC